MDAELKPTARGQLKRAAFMAIAVVGAPLLALFLVEGASSGILFTPDIIQALQATDSPDELEKHDSLLGWVSAPNVNQRDLWGPGMHLRTNAQGFRGNHNTAQRPAPGRQRILCSGDSFTMGDGVDDDNTWCALLAAKDARWESVNLGQSRYGFDQAYLRFKREGHPLEHAVHILAFITDDFRRMGLQRYHYFGKPTLALKDGALTTENVPVPRLFTPHVKLRSLLDAMPELRMAQLAQHLQARFGGEVVETAGSDSILGAVVTAIIEDLSAMSRADRAALVLVYLPTLPDYLDAAHSADPWRDRIRAASDRAKNVLYLDLITELRRLPPDSVLSMFIPYKAHGHNHGGWGHLTPGGNQWVADLLFKHLGRIPELLSQPR